MLVEPDRKGILDQTRDERRRLARSQPLLGLTGELRLAHAYRQHVGEAVPDVFGRELEPARQKIAELAELAHGIGDAGAQAVDVRTPLDGRNQVDVAFADQFAAVRDPAERPLGDFRTAGQAGAEGLVRQALRGAEGFQQVGTQAAGVEPLLVLTGGLDVEDDLESGAEHGLRPQRMAQLRHRHLVRIEILRVRPEMDRRAGRTRRHLADRLELVGEVPVPKRDQVFDAVAPYPALEPAGQRIDDRNAHAVQTAGVLVVALGEFAAGVQLGQDQFDPGHLFSRMHVDRHAPALVRDGDRVVPVERDTDLLAVPGKRLVDAVVDHFVDEVVRAAGIGVHARASPHGVEAGQNFNGGRIVGLAHRSLD